MDEVQRIECSIVRAEAKMKGKVYQSCVRAAMVYGNETWIMKKEEEGVLVRVE